MRPSRAYNNDFFHLAPLFGDVCTPRSAFLPLQHVDLANNASQKNAIVLLLCRQSVDCCCRASFYLIFTSTSVPLMGASAALKRLFFFINIGEHEVGSCTFMVLLVQNDVDDDESLNKMIMMIMPALFRLMNVNENNLIKERGLAGSQVLVYC